MELFFEPQIYAELAECDLLFDSDAIIDIVDFKANYIIEKLIEGNTSFVYTHQVFLEIMATNSLALRTSRQLFLDQYGFKEMEHIERVARPKAVILQEELHKLDCHPSPTDLYQGACLHHLVNATPTFLVTANVKDFPSPIFKKVGFLVLNGDKNVQALTVVKFAGYRQVMKIIESEDDEIPF